MDKLSSSPLPLALLEKEVNQSRTVFYYANVILSSTNGWTGEDIIGIFRECIYYLAFDSDFYFNYSPDKEKYRHEFESKTLPVILEKLKSDILAFFMKYKDGYKLRKDLKISPADFIPLDQKEAYNKFLSR